ncbi:MAG: hypothetical protein WCP73_09320, partial [Eubacteriales bacterium]
YEFDGYIQNAVQKGQTNDVIQYEQAETSKYAFYTPDHFYPLLYALGAADDHYTADVFNQSCIAGSLSMTSYVFR